MTEAQSIAADLKADGQPMTLTRSTIGEYDPVEGVMPEPVTQTWTVYGITKSYKVGDINREGSLILSGDKKALISALVEPKPGDTLTIMSKIWSIIAVDELSPQGEALLYTCQVRK